MLKNKIALSTGKMGSASGQVVGLGQMIARVPLGRRGEPEEIAAALYFGSDESRFTTGTEPRLDDGLTLVKALCANQPFVT